MLEGIGLGVMGEEMLAQLTKKTKEQKIKQGIEASVRHVRRYMSMCYGWGYVGPT